LRCAARQNKCGARARVQVQGGATIEHAHAVYSPRRLCQPPAGACATTTHLEPQTESVHQQKRGGRWREGQCRRMMRECGMPRHQFRFFLPKESFWAAASCAQGAVMLCSSLLGFGALQRAVVVFESNNRVYPGCGAADPKHAVVGNNVRVRVRIHERKSLLSARHQHQAARPRPRPRWPSRWTARSLPRRAPSGGGR
jgi:hypothetical protein